MSVRLQKTTVENLIRDMEAQPDSTLAWDAQRVLAGWLAESGLEMTDEVRLLITTKLQELEINRDG